MATRLQGLSRLARPFAVSQARYFSTPSRFQRVTRDPHNIPPSFCPIQSMPSLCGQRVHRGFFVGGILLGAVLASAVGYASLHRSEQEQKRRYFELLDNHSEVLGPLGDETKGELRIIRNPEEIAQFERDNPGKKIGIIGESDFHYFLADLVVTPTGEYLVYDRYFWKQALKGISGAVILPILPDGRILFVCIYRHLLRRWVLELPRGNGEGKELLKKLVKRELNEETGAEDMTVTELGRINADSGLTLGDIRVVRVDVSKLGEHNRDPAEVSMTLHAFTREELREGVRRGYARIRVNGGERDVEIGTDAFTLCALALDDIGNKK